MCFVKELKGPFFQSYSNRSTIGQCQVFFDDWPKAMVLRKVFYSCLKMSTLVLTLENIFYTYILYCNYRNLNQFHVTYENEVCKLNFSDLCIWPLLRWFFIEWHFGIYPKLEPLIGLKLENLVLFVKKLKLISGGIKSKCTS